MIEMSFLIGDFVPPYPDISLMNIAVKYLSPATSTAIVRCPRAGFRLVWSALTYMSGLPASASRASGHGRHGKSGAPSTPAVGGDGPRDCVFRVVRVSGT